MIEKKHFTIIVVPEKAPTLFKVKFSNYIFYLLIMLTASAFLLSGFMFYHYFNVLSEYIEISDLSEQNKRLKSELDRFEATYATLSTRMEKIEGFDQKLRDITDISKYKEGELTDGKDLFGIGGPLPGYKEELSRDDHTNSLFDELSREIENLTEIANREEESLHQLLSFLEEQENLLASTPSIWPTRGFLTSGFGFRGRRMHEGIDIANRLGTVINSSADGMVIFTGIKGGYGKYIIVDHGYGISTCYGHLHSIEVKEGIRVKRGGKIGTLGNTGRSTGPHLHYEVRINGVPVNPINYILN